MAAVALTGCSTSADDASEDASADRTSATADAGRLYRGPVYAVADLTISRDVVYATGANADGLHYTSPQTRAADTKRDTLDLTLDIAVPPAEAAHPQRPTVVFLHGGGFRGGSKTLGDDLIRDFASAGYVAATVDYRLTPDNQRTPARRLLAVTTALEDTHNAIRFLKANATAYGIDPERIVTIGGSAGGALSLLAGVEPDRPALASAYPGVSSTVAATIATGATLVNDDSSQQSARVSIDPGDAPALIFHAKDTDKTTGATWSDNVLPTQAAYAAAGVDCRVVAQPDRTHTVYLGLSGTYHRELVDFLATHLQLP